MKKTIIAIIAAITLTALAIPASANMDGSWSRDNWIKIEKLEVRRIEGGLACFAPYNSRVQTALHFAPGNWGTGRYSKIRVMDGPEKGCIGIFKAEPARVGGSTYFSWYPLPPRNSSENRNEARVDEARSNSSPREIFTTGRWGDYVPVFRTQNDFFNARDRDIFRNVVCKLKKGHQVKFTPYKDWGLGEVVRDNCKGWIDRGVIR